MSNNIVLQNPHFQPSSIDDSYSKTKPTAIEVLHVDPGDAPGVLAIVAVRVGGVVVRGVRVTNRGRGVFVNMPSRKIDNAWVDLVEIVSPALRSCVNDTILAAVRVGGAA